MALNMQTLRCQNILTAIAAGGLQMAMLSSSELRGVTQAATWWLCFTKRIWQAHVAHCREQTAYHCITLLSLHTSTSTYISAARVLTSCDCGRSDAAGNLCNHLALIRAVPLTSRILLRHNLQLSSSRLHSDRCRFGSSGRCHAC
jgi:hypothetical protein